MCLKQFVNCENPANFPYPFPIIHNQQVCSRFFYSSSSNQVWLQDRGIMRFWRLNSHINRNHEGFRLQSVSASQTNLNKRCLTSTKK